MPSQAEIERRALALVERISDRPDDARFEARLLAREDDAVRGRVAALKAALKDAEYVRPAPECLDLLPAATEKEAFFLPADATHGAVLTADGDLEDKLSDAMDDEWPMVALKLASWADVDALADYQYMLRKPLCLICGDAELLEAGLRAYQGRALYEGNLTEDALAPLVEKYGLLV